MKWRAFSRTPQWVRLSEWLGICALQKLSAANPDSWDWAEALLLNNCHFRDASQNFGLSLLYGEPEFNGCNHLCTESRYV